MSTRRGSYTQYPARAAPPQLVAASPPRLRSSRSCSLVVRRPARGPARLAGRPRSQPTPQALAARDDGAARREHRAASRSRDCARAPDPGQPAVADEIWPDGQARRRASGSACARPSAAPPGSRGSSAATKTVETTLVDADAPTSAATLLHLDAGRPRRAPLPRAGASLVEPQAARVRASRASLHEAARRASTPGLLRDRRRTASARSPSRRPPGRGSSSRLPSASAGSPPGDAARGARQAGARNGDRADRRRSSSPSRSPSTAVLGRVAARRSTRRRRAPGARPPSNPLTFKPTGSGFAARPARRRDAARRAPTSSRRARRRRRRRSHLERPGRLDPPAPPAPSRARLPPAHVGSRRASPVARQRGGAEGRPRSTRRPGAFTWRYANTPAQLQALWKPDALDADDAGRRDGLPGRPRPRRRRHPRADRPGTR